MFGGFGFFPTPFSTPICPWCGHNPQSQAIGMAIPTTELVEEQTLHILKCTMSCVDRFGVDISDILSKRTFIHTVYGDDDENPTRLYEEMKYENDENMMMDDEDLEEEIKDLEMDNQKFEYLINKPIESDVVLKFKFTNGVRLEGSFKKTDVISEIVQWISCKSGIMKESIGLRVDNRIFDNMVVLENKSTLEELNIKSNSTIHCIVRIFQ